MIIAGDIGHYNKQAKELFIQLKKFYNDIIIIDGNHDRYLISGKIVDKYKALSENRIRELKDICTNLDIYFLSGEVIEINGVRIGGTCSWYDLPTENNIIHWKHAMNDSRLIYNGYKNQPYGMYQSYSQPNSNWNTQEFWLEEKTKLLNIAKQGCDIFITHVGLNFPPDSEVYSEYIGNPDNIFYYTSNMEILKTSGCKIHIHGHTHQLLDYTVEGINILCNPYGYPSDVNHCIVKQIEFIL